MILKNLKIKKEKKKLTQKNFKIKKKKAKNITEKFQDQK